MRCQKKGCLSTSIREDHVQAEVSAALSGMRLNPDDGARLRKHLKGWLSQRTDSQDRQALKLQLESIEGRLEKLTDALIDGLIDREIFAVRKEKLEAERLTFHEKLREPAKIEADRANAEKYLELVSSLYLQHEMGNGEQKKRIAEIAFSNRTLRGKSLCLRPQKWMQDPQWAIGVLCGPPDQDTSRTKQEIVEALQILQKDPCQ
jgi:hypothetical protein